MRYFVLCWVYRLMRAEFTPEEAAALIEVIRSRTAVPRVEIPEQLVPGNVI